MNPITAHLSDKTLSVFLHGRVDSANAAETEAAIQELCNQSSYEELILDADDLLYISSAGLRVILRLCKANRSIKIIHASPEVYEILEMTGFTEMLPVEKAYRKLSIDGCEMIGQGANGKVYRLEDDTIIKVYINPDSLPEIHRERELARRAFVLGVPTAIPYDVVKVGNSYGSVFEMLTAKSLSKLIAEDSDHLDGYIEQYVDLLHKIHGTEVKPEDMPDMKAVVLDWVNFLKEYLPEGPWNKLRRLVEEVPEDHHMIHGDYHTKNVMLQDGEALLIDMDTLAQGAPIFEFASIFNAYLGFSALDTSVSMSFLGLPHEIAQQIWDKTLQLYFATTDRTVLAAVEDKASLIGYVRLMRRLIRRNGRNTEEGRATIQFYQNQILSLLDRVDTLML